MTWVNQSDKNEIIHICMVYRFTALALSTAVYLSTFPDGGSEGQIKVVLGMVTASILGAYLYLKCFYNDNQFGVNLTLSLEIVAYGLFIVLSGGFSSPYLWYFVSCLTIVMATRRWKTATLFSIIWGIACAWIGRDFGSLQSNATYMNLNMAIGFLTAVGGFYALIAYMRKLHQNREILRALNISLEEVAKDCIISEEQNRIANEIHDTVLQKLFAIACNLYLLSEKQNMLSKEAKEELRYIGTTVESTMRELREAIYGLRWNVDGNDVFLSKLTTYLDELEQLSGAVIKLEVDGETQFMTVHQKTALYRIICEAANNSIRHGHATEVKIQMQLDDASINATIQDNGQGMPQTQLPKHGQGLKNMHRLVNLLRGELSIDSEIEKGTAIRFSVPRDFLDPKGGVYIDDSYFG